MSDPIVSIVLPVHKEGEAAEPVLRGLGATVTQPHELVVMHDFDGVNTVPVFARLTDEPPYTSRGPIPMAVRY